MMGYHFPSFAVPYVTVMTITQQQICHRITKGQGVGWESACIRLLWECRIFFSNTNPNIFITIFVSHVEMATLKQQCFKVTKLATSDSLKVDRAETERIIIRSSELVL